MSTRRKKDVNIINKGDLCMGANVKKSNEESVFTARFLEQNSKNPKTLDELGVLFGASRQTVAHWLNGSSFPSAPALARIARFYNVSADYLLGLTDTESADVSLRAAAEYTGLSEQAVERIHDGLSDFECGGDKISEYEKRKNQHTASQIIQSTAFSKILYNLQQLADVAYREHILKILNDQYSNCDLPEEDPNFRYAKREDRNVVVSGLIHVLEREGQIPAFTDADEINGLNDEALAAYVQQAFWGNKEDNELHQFHAAKALSGYIDQVVRVSQRKAEQRFKK